jgi:response regulator of citrate/malate metabolism
VVSEAATVAEAMTGLSDPPPRWILLDLMLPDGCGIDVLRRVRSSKLATKTCIITGCAGELLTEARRAGAEHTFIKPLDVERLVTVMDADMS